MSLDKGVRKPTIFNVTMTLANTEYSQPLPANTRAIEFHTQAESAFRFAWITGKVAAPTAPYYSVLSGARYWKDHIHFNDVTLYFASSNAGKIIEIIAWVG